MKHISLISSQFARRTYVGFGRRCFGPYIFRRAAVLSCAFVDLRALAGKNHSSLPFHTDKQCLQGNGPSLWIGKMVQHMSTEEFAGDFTNAANSLLGKSGHNMTQTRSRAYDKENPTRTSWDGEKIVASMGCSSHPK